MRRTRHKWRTGAAAVEFALVVPLVFLLFFAAFEFTRVNMVRDTSEMAAYEGARRGIVPGATAADVRSRAQHILDAVGVRNATITVTPSSITPQTVQVTVDISVPLDSNAWVTPVFLRGKTIDRAFTLKCESMGSNGS